MTVRAQLAMNREVGHAVLCAPSASSSLAGRGLPALPTLRVRGPSGLGFSLTDLLVTVAVVLLVLSVVVVTGTAVRSKSRLARCIANLQQVDRAVLGFCNENNQTLPTITPTDKNSLWWWYKEQVKR